eukprot:IDg10656t1
MAAGISRIPLCASEGEQSGSYCNVTVRSKTKFKAYLRSRRHFRI